MKILFIKIFLVLGLTLPLMAEMNDDPLIATLNVNNLELQNRNPNSVAWDIFGWAGYDENKIYFYTSGDKQNNSVSNTQNQFLYAHSIAPYWDIQIGLGRDTYGSNNKNWGVVALQGLAPYFFNTKAALLFASDGNIGLRLDLDYDLLITQKLIFTPSFSSDFYTKNAQKVSLGSGLSNVTLGVRLRYEIRREFAPYIGVEWTKNFTNTNRYDPLNDAYIVVGLKYWL